MSLRRRFLVVGVVSLSVIVAILCSRRVGRMSDQPPLSGEESLAGVQERADTTIRMLTDKSFDELVEQLSVQDGYLCPGYYSSDMPAQEDFERILSNRLTSRLLEILSQIPRAEARSRAESICNRMQSECESTLEKVLEKLREAWRT